MAPPAPRKRPTRADDFADFLADIAPIFHRRGFRYVDAGANRGDTFAEVCAAPVALESALLFEANPDVFAGLNRRLAEMECGQRATALNLALSDRASRLCLAKRGEMSTIVANVAAARGHPVVEVAADRLDRFAGRLGTGPISLLKVDVEGHELEVLAGAGALLSSGAIEAIYIEAGYDRTNRQQTYYRCIEDLLAPHGYTLMRVYEQVGDWLEDRMTLRRANLAFLSRQLVETYPRSRVRALRGEMRTGR